MKLEQQVCTLEQAKRLKELGISGETAFAYFIAPSHAGICLGDSGNLRHVWALTGNPYDREDVEFIPTFTVSELGRMIGPNTRAASKFHDAVMNRINQSFSMQVATSVQFVANCVIGLIETGVLEIEDANRRLVA